MRFVIPAGVLLLVQVTGLLGQEAPRPTTPEEDVALLRSDDIRVREAAGLRLGKLPASRVPFLRGCLSSESDCEVRERLWDALREVSVREADRVFGEGRVEDALRWLSGLPEGDERETLVLEVKRDVAHEIRTMLPESPCTDDFPQDYAVLASSIDHEFGPWGIAVLLEALRVGESDVPAAAILQEVGDHVLPCLARALENGDAAFRREVCTVLYGMTYDHDRTVEDHFGLSEGLAAVAEDSATDAGTRMRCRYVRERLRGPACEDDLPGEAR